MSNRRMSNLVFEHDPAKRPDFVYAGKSGTWAEWGAFHRDLGQELAKRLRVYPGPATDPDGGDIGGTPVLMRMAA